MVRGEKPQWYVFGKARGHHNDMNLKQLVEIMVRPYFYF